MSTPAEVHVQVIGHCLSLYLILDTEKWTNNYITNCCVVSLCTTIVGVDLCMYVYEVVKIVFQTFKINCSSIYRQLIRWLDHSLVRSYVQMPAHLTQVLVSDGFSDKGYKSKWTGLNCTIDWLTVQSGYPAPLVRALCNFTRSAGVWLHPPNYT